jgi:hypothetical protein
LPPLPLCGRPADPQPALPPVPAVSSGGAPLPAPETSSRSLPPATAGPASAASRRRRRRRRPRPCWSAPPPPSTVSPADSDPKAEANHSSNSTSTLSSTSKFMPHRQPAARSLQLVSRLATFCRDSRAKRHKSNYNSSIQLPNHASSSIAGAKTGTESHPEAGRVYAIKTHRSYTAVPSDNGNEGIS